MPSARPLAHGAAVNTLCIEEVAQMLLSWLRETEPKGEASLDECRDDARKLLERYSTYDDGYDMARFLENHCGYEPNASLVDVLEGIWVKRAHAYAEVVAQWVREEGIVMPESYMNQKVRFKLGEGIAEGEIVKFYPDMAKVLIYCPEQGHVRDGRGVQGCVVNWEAVEELSGMPKWPGELTLGAESRNGDHGQA